MGPCRKSIVTLLTTITGINAARSGVETPRASNASVVYDWNQVVPSPDLNWVPCFGRFTCTRLEVPLDYGDHSVGNTSIPFIKSSAEVQPAPSLIMNPGGPGESGVNALIGFGDTLRQRYGEAQDLISFDPRGVNVSNIGLSCFPDAPGLSFLGDALVSGLSQAPQSDSDAFYRAQAYTQRCNLKLGPNSDSTARYASTPAVARDMLSFIEADALASGQPPSQAKLRFLGYSYGTLLGQTFAAMFPQRIERMILDGVVDGDTYYRGLGPPHVTEADAGMDGFFTSCHQAGPEACAFYADSPSAISSRLDSLLSNLSLYPIPVGDPAISQIPTLANAFQLRSLLFSVLYTPLPTFPTPGQTGFPDLARVLSDLEDRNASSLIRLGGFDLSVPSDPSAAVYDADISSQLILCIDNYHTRVPMATLPAYRSFLAELRAQSRWVGETQASTRSGCVGSEIIPPRMGTFPLPLPPSAGNTSFPILFVNPTRDPATPPTDAVTVSRRFAGSAVVLLDAIGHTTLAAPSGCLDGIYRAYLAEGTMPANGTVCAADELPFGVRA